MPDHNESHTESLLEQLKKLSSDDAAALFQKLSVVKQDEFCLHSIEVRSAEVHLL